MKIEEFSPTKELSMDKFTMEVVLECIKNKDLEGAEEAIKTQESARKKMIKIACRCKKD